MAPGSRRARWLGLSIILAATVWIGGIVGIVGSYLSSPEYQVIRFCDGRCICDGGSLDAGLMGRVCPEGWERVLARSKRKLRNERRRLLRERARRLRESPPPPPESSMVPVG